MQRLIFFPFLFRPIQWSLDSKNNSLKNVQEKLNPDLISFSKQPQYLPFLDITLSFPQMCVFKKNGCGWGDLFNTQFLFMFVFKS